MTHGKKLVLTYSSFRRKTGTSASSTIKLLKPHFSRNCKPEEVISDNGPQFGSEKFEKFAKDLEFKHTTSSTRYPQSNGLAERTIKNILKKSLPDKRDPNVTLLDLRNTPIQGIGKSPV